MHRVALLSSLANQTRLDILALLVNEGALSVNEVAEKLSLQQASASRHLIILRDGGAVKMKQVQTRRIYTVEEDVRGIIAAVAKVAA